MLRKKAMFRGPRSCPSRSQVQVQVLPSLGRSPETVSPLVAHPTPNSICVFSGKNDDPTAPLDGSGPNGPGGVAQSYGQDVKLGLANPHFFTPGAASGRERLNRP